MKFFDDYTLAIAKAISIKQPLIHYANKEFDSLIELYGLYLNRKVGAANRTLPQLSALDRGDIMHDFLRNFDKLNRSAVDFTIEQIKKLDDICADLNVFAADTKKIAIEIANGFKQSNLTDEFKSNYRISLKADYCQFEINKIMNGFGTRVGIYTPPAFERFPLSI